MDNCLNLLVGGIPLGGLGEERPGREVSQHSSGGEVMMGRVKLGLPSALTEILA